MPDSEALKLTLKLVEQAAEVDDPAPDRLGWYQAEWFVIGRNQIGWHTFAADPMCLTAGCFAGHYAFSQGFTEPFQTPGGPGLRNPVTREILLAQAREQCQPTVARYAMEGLGLDPDQADWLFCANNTLEDLQMIVDDLCDGDDA
jgi:hypothetical protein